MRKWIFSCGFYYDRGICFFDTLTRRFARYDIDNNSITYEPDIYRGEDNFYIEKFVEIGDDIYGIDVGGEKVMHIDMADRTATVISIDAKTGFWGNYSYIGKTDDKVVIFTRGKGKKIEIIKNKVLEASIPDSVFIGGEASFGFVFFDKSGERILKYYKERNVWDEKKTNISVGQVVYAEESEGVCFFMDLDGDIFTYDPRDDSIEKKYSIQAQGGSMIEFFITGNKIIELPSLGDDIFVIDRTSGVSERWDRYPGDFAYVGPKGWSRYDGFNDIDGYRYYSMRTANYLLRVDRETGEIDFLKPSIPRPEVEGEMIIRSNMFATEETISLSDYVKYISCTRI